MTKKHCFTVGREGQTSLNILEKGSNDQTKYFLNKHGLESELSILDIGCASVNLRVYFLTCLFIKCLLVTLRNDHTACYYERRNKLRDGGSYA
jgi:hypothetical protein